MDPHLDDDLYRCFTRLLQHTTGVRVRPGGRTEFESLLRDRIEALQLDDFDQYLAVLRDGGSEEELQGWIDAVVPDESTPLLDDHHVVASLRTWLEEREQPIRVWCAGCGDGREARDFLALVDAVAPELGVEVVGTDVQAGLIEAAEAGVTEDPRLRFEVANLLDASDGPGTFDLVLLRSVLTDFDVPTRSRVLDGIHAQLRADGLLVLGEGESLLNISHPFRLLQPSIFLRTVANARSRT